MICQSLRLWCKRLLQRWQNCRMYKVIHLLHGVFMLWPFLLNVNICPLDVITCALNASTSLSALTLYLSIKSNANHSSIKCYQQTHQQNIITGHWKLSSVNNNNKKKLAFSTESFYMSSSQWMILPVNWIQLLVYWLASSVMLSFH